MLVVVDHEIGYSVDGIQVCVREEFKIYDPTEIKNDSKNAKKKTK